MDRPVILRHLQMLNPQMYYFEGLKCELVEKLKVENRTFFILETS